MLRNLSRGLVEYCTSDGRGGGENFWKGKIDVGPLRLFNLYIYNSMWGGKGNGNGNGNGTGVDGGVSDAGDIRK